MTIIEMPTPVAAHAWAREKHEHYVEPHWCSERLFAVEDFKDSIWDPCCGFGRIPEAANRAGLIGLGTDVVNRGWHGQKTMIDFLQSEAPLSENIVCNPPFNIAGQFMRHAIDLPGVEKVAMIFPTARLGHYRVDFLISYSFFGRQLRLVVECDGHDFHERTKAQAIRDRRRDRALQSQGLKVFRFTGSEINATPTLCAMEALDEIESFQSRCVMDAYEIARRKAA